MCVLYGRTARLIRSHDQLAISETIFVEPTFTVSAPTFRNLVNSRASKAPRCIVRFFGVS
jgi:hypothetical protein